MSALHGRLGVFARRLEVPRRARSSQSQRQHLRSLRWFQSGVRLVCWDTTERGLESRPMETRAPRSKIYTQRYIYIFDLWVSPARIGDWKRTGDTETEDSRVAGQGPSGVETSARPRGSPAASDSPLSLSLPLSLSFSLSLFLSRLQQARAVPGGVQRCVWKRLENPLEVYSSRLDGVFEKETHHRERRPRRVPRARRRSRTESSSSRWPRDPTRART